VAGSRKGSRATNQIRDRHSLSRLSQDSQRFANHLLRCFWMSIRFAALAMTDYGAAIVAVGAGLVWFAWLFKRPRVHPGSRRRGFSLSDRNFGPL
jgi:hypothetical protein